MESVAGNEGAPAVEPPRIICPRCGAFTESVERVLEATLCPSCAVRERERQQDIKLYPSGYLWTLGILGNGAIAAVLSALNWSRVRRPERAQTAGIVAGVCLVVSVVAAIIPRKTSVIITVMSVISTKTVLEGWKPLYEAHRRMGGRRASLMLPIVVLLGVFVVAVIVYAIAEADTDVE
jgi:hypothetical protein